MHDPPAAMEPPQVLVSANGALALTEETVAAVPPGLETVTVCAALVDPVATLPNDRLVGDGTSADGAKVSHAYTSAGEFTIRLKVDGVDEVPAHKDFSVKVTGNLKAHSNLTDNRRFVEPTDR